MRSPGEQERSVLFPTSNTIGGTFLPFLACDTRNLNARDMYVSHASDGRIQCREPRRGDYSFSFFTFLSRRLFGTRDCKNTPEMGSLVEADSVRYRVNEDYRVRPSQFRLGGAGRMSRWIRYFPRGSQMTVDPVDPVGAAIVLADEAPRGEPHG